MIAQAEPGAMSLDAILPADTPVSRARTAALSIAAVASSAVLGYVVATLTVPPSASVVEAPVVATSAAPLSAASPSSATLPAPVQSDERPHVLQASAYSPAFAASGAVYFHQQTADTSALKMGERAGNDRLIVTTILDDHAKNFHVRPSPDGSLIAYDSDREGDRAVFVARSDGSGARRLSGTGYAAVPSWSPDGRQIAFVRAEADRPKVWNLWVANADGSQLRRLTSHASGQAWGGSWFPDGRRIAYSVESRLVILDLATGRPSTLHSPVSGQLVRTPAVSPDGRRIIFQVRHDGTWVADVASGRMTRVLDDPTAEEFAWATDGRHVAYHSRRSGTWSVWVMTV
jgi:Tol biopolymer transport system component